MAAMTIHQIQLRYESVADRLLLQVRTRQSELYAVWLTRRMTARLNQPFRDAVTRQALQTTAPTAMPVPEAKSMLEQAARERPLPGTDFQQPFVADNASHPLGPEPLLPAEIDIRSAANGNLVLALREARGRRLELALTADLATALLRLLDQVLKSAEWQLPDAGTAAAAAATDAEPAAPRLLN